MVIDLVKAHDARMDERRDEWDETKALWKSAWWPWVRGQAEKASQTWEDNRWSVRGDIETNRMWPFLHGYQNQIYHRPGTPIVTPDPFQQGDPRAVKAVVQHFLNQRKTHDKFLNGFRQGLMFDGVGAKVGYVPGTAPAYRRVFLRVLPYWEMLLDHDVSDVDDARFYGHAFWRPKADVEEEFGLVSLKGNERDTFLGDPKGAVKPADKDPEKDKGGFVRVLEFINLVDNYVDDDGNEYQGRFEVYVLKQGEIEREDGTKIPKNQPVSTGPIPFADSDGVPTPHILPLIFNPEPEAPLKGVPHATRVKSQCVELNLLRTISSASAKKDARQYLYRKGKIGPEGEALIQEGIDGAMIPVEDESVSLDNVVVAIKNSAVSMNIHDAARSAERDLDIAAGQSPNARGQITKATAEEIQQVTRYTEGDFGYHAQRRDEWMEAICQLFVRATMAAMQDMGDYTGAFDQDDVDVFAIGADRAANEEDKKELAELAQEAAESYENADESVETGEEDEPSEEMQAGEVDLALLLGDVVPAVDSDMLDVDDEDVLVQQAFTIMDGNEPVEVSVDSLNGEFRISFSDEGITPSDAVEQQRNLLGVMEQYMGLWQAYQEGDAAAKAMAWAYMEALHSRFRLPQSLAPQALIAKMREEEGEIEEKEPPPEEIPEEPAPQLDMGALREMAVTQPRAALEQMRQMMPDMAPQLDQLAAMPDEQLAQSLVAVVDQMTGPAPMA